MQGLVLHTSDGGVSYSPQTSGTPFELNGVAFVNASQGWAVGSVGQIIHTTNGGTTWNPQTSGTTNWLTRGNVQRREPWLGSRRERNNHPHDQRGRDMVTAASGNNGLV